MQGSALGAAIHARQKYNHWDCPYYKKYKIKRFLITDYDQGNEHSQNYQTNRDNRTVNKVLYQFFHHVSIPEVE